MRSQEFSTAGFYQIEHGNRVVYNFNPVWRFYKGMVEGGEALDFDDSRWEIVNLPHGLELLPLEASGTMNYQGPAWYRKKFLVDTAQQGRKLYLHFEAIMGKCKIWINGKLKAEHYGGFLPIVLDITDDVDYGQQNLVAIWTDNSDDPMYPPGKAQDLLDWTYFGGIYRDVWFYTTAPVHITDPILANKVAGGGVFVHYETVSKEQAIVVVDTEVINETNTSKNYLLETRLLDQQGQLVASSQELLALEPFSSLTITQRLVVNNPQLWHPNHSKLYNLDSLVIDEEEQIVDGIRNRIGIRSVEFRGADGLFVNGQPYPGKLIGVNRHQDYAYIGNALPNSGHWRDAQKLREAGVTVVRAAHYPQDPAFMDACDELGIFVIVTTPGWQFFNDSQLFLNRVYDDIRNMVRRDRNRPSVLMWEPILNETRYSQEFVETAHRITHEEYPYPGCYTAGDDHLKINQILDVMYGHEVKLENKSYFTREWGDNVDDWNAQNANNRVHKGMGEDKQLTQAFHFLKTAYPFTNFDTLYKAPAQHVGGALWCGIDHQRGYHPDPFWGGILDAFRQPKYAWYAFKSQQSPKIEPMIFIAHEMTPFSSSDIVVFTNCQEVRLTIYGEETRVKQVPANRPGLPHPPVVFEKAFDFMKLKERVYNVKTEVNVEIVAEGYIDGKLVAKHVRRPAGRKSKIVLKADFAGIPLQADGVDFVPVVAYITDQHGTVKRLAKDWIRFEVTGEGEIVGDLAIYANPTQAQWGEAVALVRSTLKPGEIVIRAFPQFASAHSIRPAELVIESVAPLVPLLAIEQQRKLVQLEAANSKAEKNLELSQTVAELERQLQAARQEIQRLRLEQVHEDQADFGYD